MIAIVASFRQDFKPNKWVFISKELTHQLRFNSDTVTHQVMDKNCPKWHPFSISFVAKTVKNLKGVKFTITKNHNSLLLYGLRS